MDIRNMSDMQKENNELKKINTELKNEVSRLNKEKCTDNLNLAITALNKEVARLKRVMRSEEIKAENEKEHERVLQNKIRFVFKNEIAELKKWIKMAKGYHKSASKEAKLFGYKTLGQLARIYGFAPETLRTYHKTDRDRFMRIMRECEHRIK